MPRIEEHEVQQKTEVKACMQVAGEKGRCHSNLDRRSLNSSSSGYFALNRNGVGKLRLLVLSFNAATLHNGNDT